jgi:cytochrome c oxidase subunit IV
MSDHDEHGLSHVASVKTLLGTWGSLMVLTIVTVLATKIDLGTTKNLMLAMVIAFVKASLVVTFFMHLKYDRLFHTVLLIFGICAASLFVGYTLLDSNQYQESIIWDYQNPPEAPFGPHAPV